MKAKIIFFSIITVVLFYLSIFAAGILPFVSKMRTELSQEKIFGYFIDIVLHPIRHINEMIVEDNPLIYLTFIASIILIVYLIFKTRKKNYDIVGDSYGVQGSARWAKTQEVMRREDELLTVSIDDLNNDIENSLKFGGSSNE
ncbi:hypothetical protein NST36_19160 [Bacillus sp. FSL R5-0293]|uniref:hypothetical protein n=1 Tax=Bacillus sp. FSL R5-0293 TaxID=2954584 RepID=UPI0030F7AC68